MTIDRYSRPAESVPGKTLISVGQCKPFGMHDNCGGLRRKPSRYLTLAFCSLACLGCGSDEFPFAPVSGVVELNGEPLADAWVGFDPMAKSGGVAAGKSSYARTDAEGRFELASIDDRKGAVVGPHRVWIRTFKTDKNGKIIRQESLPRNFNDETTLIFEVPQEGTVNANFQLEPKLLRSASSGSSQPQGFPE